MTLNKTISTLNQELIAAFAELDSWFDYDPDQVQTDPGQWNPRQVLEHVVLTNHFLLKIIDKGCDRAAALPFTGAFPEDYTLELPKLLEIADPQAFEWHRPDHMEPSGDRPFETLRDEFRDQLYRCLCNLDKIENGCGILYRVSMSVNGLGKLDVYQYLYFVAMHIRRHVVQLQRRQIVETE